MMNQHLTVALFLFAVAPLQAAAAEVAGMEIVQNGQHIAGFAVTYDGESEAEMWQMLKEIPLTFERDFAILPEANDEKTAVLSGEMVIRTYRRGDAGTGTTTDQLRLVRRGSSDWYVSQADVARTLKAAGLTLESPELPRPKTESGGDFWVVCLCLVGLIGGSVALSIFTRPPIAKS